MWREELLSLVRTGGFKTQGELVTALKTGGYDVTQASVSRELKARDIRKHNGFYVLADTSLPEGIPVLEATAPSPQTMVVLKSHPAIAPMLSQSIDDAHIQGVLGTIAGNDTVFVTVTGERGRRALERWMGTAIQTVPDVPEVSEPTADQHSNIGVN